MGSVEKYNKVSREAFLEYLDSIEGKAEYLDGEIFDMAGGSPAHSLISNNVGAELRECLKGRGCRAYNSDLTIELPVDGAIVFPDGSVVCGDLIPTFDRADIITNPTLIVEVVSPSSSRYDRRGKLRKYFTIPSLKEYMIIEQREAQVDVWTKSETGEWKFNTYQELTESVKLFSLGIELKMSEIYRDVEFAV
jgi:Uma2 family endonuclease